MHASRLLVATAASLTAAGALAGVALAGPAASGTTVKVTLGKPSELKMQAAPAAVKAGPVTFVVTNKGKAPHEMVVVPLAKGETKVAMKNGRAVEKGALGEAPEMGGGKTKTITLNLKKGKYVLLCNVPGHYAGGMFTSFNVT
jgi:uncharacterized cupredoxin-like copper-binding protein